MSWFLRESSCSSWFTCYLKKQTQFLVRSNEFKVNYNKEIREKYWIGHLVKTNPIVRLIVRSSWFIEKQRMNISVNRCKSVSEKM